jgi:hypothetical protein
VNRSRLLCAVAILACSMRPAAAEPLDGWEFDHGSKALTYASPVHSMPLVKMSCENTAMVRFEWRYGIGQKARGVLKISSPRGSMVIEGPVRRSSGGEQALVLVTNIDSAMMNLLRETSVEIRASDLDYRLHPNSGAFDDLLVACIFKRQFVLEQESPMPSAARFRQHPPED